MTAFAFIGVLATNSFAADQRQWDRASLWNPGTVKMVDTAKYKKKPPYKIGFANAGISNSWAVFMHREVQAEAERHPNLIEGSRTFMT